MNRFDNIKDLIIKNFIDHFKREAIEDDEWFYVLPNPNEYPNEVFNIALPTFEVGYNLNNMSIKDIKEPDLKRRKFVKEVAHITFKYWKEVDNE